LLFGFSLGRAVLTLLGRLLLHCSFGVKGLISLAWFRSHLRFRFSAVMQE
jgi:hypothetical protein